jgi:hypothetical protein
MSPPNVSNDPVENEEHFVYRLTKEEQRVSYLWKEDASQRRLVRSILEPQPPAIVQIEASDTSTTAASSLTAEQVAALEDRSSSETSGSSISISRKNLPDQFGKQIVAKVFPVHKFVANEDADYFGSRLCRKVFLSLGDEVCHRKWFTEEHHYLKRTKNY